MRKITCTILAFITACAIFAFTHAVQQKKASPFPTYKPSPVVSCSPDISKLSILLEGMDIPPMPGAGIYKWKVATTSDSAQFYFNQGMNMYYGFHIIEALASFKKATRFDSASPMVWWALALAYGPNINDNGYAASPEALSAAGKALALSAAASPVEKGLIEAMQVRYAADTTQKRETLNEAYAAAMKKVYAQHNHADVGALYADALMVQHPWDLWKIDGTPKAWTPAIRAVLEKVLAATPLHPGANHYYIHVMEASPYAIKALPSANRLGKLTPGLSHMVHMPSHIYLRTGQYEKGSSINAAAVDMYKQYAALYPAVQENPFLYQWHNQHMQANCALMAGNYEEAQTVAAELQNALDTAMLSLPAPMGTAVQYVYMTPVLMDAHFGKWQKLLQTPQPASHHTYASILYHFGKGMAHVGLNDIEGAKDQLAQIEGLIRHPDLKIPFGPNSPPVDGATVAQTLLKGCISMKMKEHQQAITHFKNAVQREENMVYNEPRDWMLNPKQYLGAAYMAAQQWQLAEATFKKDLAQNAQNMWSLYGLEKALLAQQKTAEAGIIKKQQKVTGGKNISTFTGLAF